MAAGTQWVTLVPISNMNRAIRFYTKALGGKVVYRGRGAMRNFWAALKIGGSDIWLVAPQKREKRSLAYSVLLVKNARSTVARLKAKGVKFRRPERMSRESKVDGSITYDSFGASAFFKDTEGNLLMLWQNFPPI
ncbi:glyoxalase/bleomycin resistance protein/dioxygenase [mine drainage metagenome]|uniref:Glyoxalase/bleomycin resistance protein/dioxygenase n=1 Tax=mine drainage metagenome TaxID=410659 RepID=T1BCQ8_9ZZZZ